MAIRARLSAPKEFQLDWPYHELKSASLPASMLFSSDRRMEAENFLAAGFITRQLIVSKSTGWLPLAEVAQTWQPSRLKGIQVSPEFGSPFLAATQVFDLRPSPRKWLSLDRTDDYAQRYIDEGTIVLTCSGSVGRATLATANLKEVLISHDLLRVAVRRDEDRGWIYAYLRSPTIRAMMTSAQYGHMIKHLEVSHLDALPYILCPSKKVRMECSDRVARIISLRNSALSQLKAAEQKFTDIFSATNISIDGGEAGFVVTAGDTFMSGRRRFDAYRSNPGVRSIEKRLAASATEMQSLRSVGCKVWLPNRFRRVPADDGVDLVDSSSIFEINPDYRRRISPNGISDRSGGFIQPGWLLMSRSGQVYGLLGSVAMATEQYEGKIITDDVIRIDADKGIDPGYLHLTLSHETLGRPRVKSLAYGSSIPHIEVEDLLDFTVPRLPKHMEAELGLAVRGTYKHWSEADRLEMELSEIGEGVINEFLSSVDGKGIWRD